MTGTPQKPAPVAKANEDIEEMISSARAIKGDSFAQVAVSWCEALQATRLIAAVRVAAQPLGQEVVAKCDAISRLIGASSARAVGLLKADDVDEAMTLAKRMLDVIDAARRSITGGMH